MIPVLLSGGSGTRLWPLSRTHYPKQFLPLVDDETLFQNTLRRLDGMPGLATPVVVCNTEHRFLVAGQLQEMGRDPASIILEPEGRNTAPAVALAALDILERGGDPLMLVLPADHALGDIDAFHAAVARAAAAARDGCLVTFGIRPDHPHTGYGYIRRGDALPDHAGVFRTEAFVEKPGAATAAEYVTLGDYYWNSGMFLFDAGRYLDELERFAPEILDTCRRACANAHRDLDFTRVDAAAFAACPGNSIDYAVMEHTESAVVVPLEAGWSDVGAWSALYDVARDRADADGNVQQGDVVARGVRNSYLRAESRLLAAVGVEDLVVVETADAVLVCRQEQVQDVKSLVDGLRAQGRPEADLHKRVYRPWGWYEGVATSDRFQVKRILVNPGAALSLQMHHHRAEHWVVVRGTARVHCDDRMLLVSEDESTYIPIGSTHRLENPGRIPLELVEVQTGSYLGEDDIVRLEDVYGRKGEGAKPAARPVKDKLRERNSE